MVDLLVWYNFFLTGKSQIRSNRSYQLWSTRLSRAVQRTTTRSVARKRRVPCTETQTRGEPQTRATNKITRRTRRRRSKWTRRAKRCQKISTMMLETASIASRTLTNTLRSSTARQLRPQVPPPLGCPRWAPFQGGHRTALVEGWSPKWGLWVRLGKVRVPNRLDLMSREFKLPGQSGFLGTYPPSPRLELNQVEVTFTQGRVGRYLRFLIGKKTGKRQAGGFIFPLVRSWERIRRLDESIVILNNQTHIVWSVVFHAHWTKFTLTLLRMINVKFLSQPHQKYYIPQRDNLAFQSLLRWKMIIQLNRAISNSVISKSRYFELFLVSRGTYNSEVRLYYKFSLPHLYIFSLEGWENVLFDLRNERFKLSPHSTNTNAKMISWAPVVSSNVLLQQVLSWFNLICFSFIGSK